MTGPYRSKPLNIELELNEEEIIKIIKRDLGDYFDAYNQLRNPEFKFKVVKAHSIVTGIEKYVCSIVITDDYAL